MNFKTILKIGGVALGCAALYCAYEKYVEDYKKSTNELLGKMDVSVKADNVEIKEVKIAKTKAANSITKRHNEAAKEMEKSVKKITSKSPSKRKTKNDDALDKMQKKLKEL